MKKLNLWVAVDLDGWVAGYSRKPTWSETFGWFYEEDDCYVYLGKRPSHAGKCWRVEIVPPTVKKRAKSIPPFAEPGDEVARRKHGRKR